MKEDEIEVYTSFGSKIRNALSYVTVEPAVIGSLFMLYLYTMLGKQYIFERLVEEYNVSDATIETSCNETANTTDPDYILIQKISSETAQWVSYLALATFIPAIYSTVVFGSWSDEFGRKIPMLISLIGFVVIIVTYVLVVNLELPFACLFVGHIICGFCGDSATLLACAFSYVSDISRAKSRTMRITVIEASTGLAGFISSVSGGIWLNRRGYAEPFWFLLALTIADLIYIAVRIEAKESEKELANLKYLFTKEPFVHIYEVMKPQREDPKRHINLWLFQTAFLILIITIIGIAVILVVYEIGIPFCWNSVQVGISQGIVQFGYLVILVLIKVFSGVSNEMKLVLVGVLANFTASFILAFAKADWMIYFGVFIQMLYFLPSPILRSQSSRLVSQEEVGSIFALLSCVGNIASVIAAALFNNVFAATVDSSLPGAAFLLSPILLVFFLITYGFGYSRSKKALSHLGEKENYLEYKNRSIKL